MTAVWARTARWRAVRARRTRHCTRRAQGGACGALAHTSYCAAIGLVLTSAFQSVGSLPTTAASRRGARPVS